MDRKTIKIILADKKEYTFSERNREDTDFAGLQNEIREERMLMIQKVVNNPDNQLALLMQEMRRIYTQDELNIYVTSSPEKLKKAAYDSFKIANPAVTYEDFKKLLPDDRVKTVVKIITELESEEGAVETDLKKKRPSRSQKKFLKP